MSRPSARAARRRSARPIRKLRPCGGKHYVAPVSREIRALRFVCRGCKELICGICEGASDDYPNLCDRCWVKATRRSAPFKARAFVGLLSIPKRRAITWARERFSP